MHLPARPSTANTHARGRVLPFAFWLLLIAVLSACSQRLSPLTSDLRQQNGWSTDELQRIQFYLSEDITLTRQRSRGSTDIAQGRVRVENGREIEEVVFQRGTPGLALFSPKDDHLAIGFDPGDDGRFLVFGPNPKQGGRYTLLASDWQRTQGKVKYDGQVWEVSAANADANLLFDLRRRGSTERATQRPSGRRIGN